jgi:hypothetical protein
MASAASDAAAAAAAGASRLPTLSQSLSVRRTEVESWTPDGVRVFWRYVGELRVSNLLMSEGVDGRALWAASSSMLGRFNKHRSVVFPAPRGIVHILRGEEEDVEEHTLERINRAVERVRQAQSTAIAGSSTTIVASHGTAAEEAAATQSAAAAAAMSGMTATVGAAAAAGAAAVAAETASSKRGAADVAGEEPSAKRARPANPDGSGSADEEMIGQISFGQPQSGSSQHTQSAAQPAAAATDGSASIRSAANNAAASSSASSPPALFSELPSVNNNGACIPQPAPLRIDSLPQEWFVDPVPDELICCVCMEVARDPPNLEACGQ